MSRTPQILTTTLLLAWVLGTTFAATDLLGYLLGGVSALVLLRVLRRAS